MPDLTTLKLQNYDADALWRFQHDNHGGVASEFLYRLCSAPTTELQRARVNADNIVRHLDMYGPALVSFVFHGSLPNHGTAESPMTCHGEHHAVLIVGHRTCADGLVHFLLQNWWLEKEFFTCDVHFLRARSAKLEWVTSVVPRVDPLGVGVTARVVFSVPDGAAMPEHLSV
jgi:hypothetical protein